MKYDYLIVGAGLTGSVIAEQLTKKNKKCMIVDKRSHIAGNCYTKEEKDIDVHVYGCHLFHTNKKEIWDYLNQFTEFNNYKHTGKVNFNNRVFSFPINLMTMRQLWGINTPQEAENKIKKIQVPIQNPKNMEEWCLSQIGKELYEIFIKEYSTKQWGKHPSLLPASIVKRIPFRLDYNEDYFHNSLYQGVPKKGYTNLVSNIIGDVKVELEVDFFKIDWKKYAKKLVFCGCIDQFFNYTFGKLDYRSLRWDNEVHKGSYQGCGVMNYTGLEVDYTRIIEHKYFNNKNQNDTIISKEYPMPFIDTNEPYYPINDLKNNSIYAKYNKLVKQYPDVLITGRLGKYKYIDIDDCISIALKQSEKL